MARISNQKIINDELTHQELFPQYEQILESLIDTFEVRDAMHYSKHVNFSLNKTEPIHSWFQYSQGYAKQLMLDILLKERPSREYYILDPFSGVGTTNLVAKSLGYNSIGFDINPIAHEASKTKLITLLQSSFY